MNVFDLPVFGPADAFPMLADDELQELADDIRANGLREPLVVADVDGLEVLVDGRNRREACRIAGVDPSVRRLEGEDPQVFILSANILRRHMTKGARAMAVAMIYPEGGKGGRGKKTPAKNAEVSDRFLSMARTVLAYTPTKANAVLSGAETLADAYAAAKESKQKAHARTQALEVLRKRSPELAERVEAGELSGTDAERLSRLSDRYLGGFASGELDLDEAEYLNERDAREHRESIGRAARAIEGFVWGWDIATRLHKSPSRQDILDEMEDFDRKRFLEIEKERREAGLWPA